MVYVILPLLCILAITATTTLAVISWLQQQSVISIWIMTDFIPLVWLGVIISFALLGLLIAVYLPFIASQLTKINFSNYGKN